MIGVRVGLRAVDLHLGIGHVVDAGHNVEHVIRVTDTGASRGRAAGAQHGERVQITHLNIVADVAAFGFQQAGVGGDGYRFTGRAHFQRNINSDSLRHLHIEAGPEVFLETGNGHIQFVGSNRKLCQSVVAGVGAGGLKHRPRLQVSGSHRSIGNNCSGGVSNGSGNCAAVTLGKRSPGAKQQERCQKQ